jgi:hypothetical protein
MVFLTLELIAYLASGLTLASFLAILLKKSHYSNSRSPPKPFAWPLIGHVSIFLCRQPHKIFLGVICITKYEMIKEALVRQGEIFSGRPRLNTLGHMRRGYHGLAMSDGEEWKIHRKFALHCLKEFGLGRKSMEQKILSQIRKLKIDLENQSINGRALLLAPNFEMCIANVLADLLHGRTFDHDDGKFRNFLHAVNESFKKMTSFGAGLGETLPILMRIPFIKKIIGFDQLQKIDNTISDFISDQIELCEREWDEKSAEEKIDIKDFTSAFLKVRNNWFFISKFANIDKKVRQIKK